MSEEIKHYGGGPVKEHRVGAVCSCGAESPNARGFCESCERDVERMGDAIGIRMAVRAPHVLGRLHAKPSESAYSPYMRAETLVHERNRRRRGLTRETTENGGR